MKKQLCCFVVFMALAACSSAPTHYYTLVSDTDPASVAKMVPFQYTLTTVIVPVQVDQPQIVIRQGESRVQILETERWVAPLADEVKMALSHQLTLQMGRAEGAGVARESGSPHVSLQVDVRRFESAPGRYALIDATWSLRTRVTDGTYRILTCNSVIRREGRVEIGKLVLAHQQMMTELATHIVRTLKPWMSDSSNGCIN